MSNDQQADFLLTPRQMDILIDPVRFKIVIAGRRSGKSFLAMVALIKQAASKPNQVCWYLGPNLDDTRDVMWKPLLEWLPTGAIKNKNDTRLEVTLTNGSEIRMMSAEKSKRGRGLDLVVLDEFAMYGSSVWEEELRPALSDKMGRAIFITTPTGHNWAYDLYLKGLSDDAEWKSWQFTTAEGGIVPATEILAARSDLDPRIFRQEYEASFEVMAGRVYSNFDRAHNVRSDIVDTGGEVLVGMDFNVNPMSAVIAVRAGDECHILDALEIPTSNTEEMGNELLTRYPGRSIVVCPDPSGKARKTSAPVGQTDFTILERMGMSVRANRKAPPVVDRINNTQSMLLADERRRLLVHPQAEKLIRGLDGLTYKKDTSQPDKSGGLDHITDALGYLLWQEFNLLESRVARLQTFRI